MKILNKGADRISGGVSSFWNLIIEKTLYFIYYFIPTIFYSCRIIPPRFPSETDTTSCADSFVHFTPTPKRSWLQWRRQSAILKTRKKEAKKKLEIIFRRKSGTGQNFEAIYETVNDSFEGKGVGNGRITKYSNRNSDFNALCIGSELISFIENLEQVYSSSHIVATPTELIRNFWLSFENLAHTEWE